MPGGEGRWAEEVVCGQVPEWSLTVGLLPIQQNVQGERADQWAGLGWHSGEADRVSVEESHVERSPGQWPLLGMAVVPTRSVVSVVPASTMLGSVRTHVCQSHPLFQGLVPPAESKFTAQPHRAKAQ